MKKKYVIAASLLVAMGMSTAACSSNSNKSNSTVQSSKNVHKKKTVKLPKPDYATAEDAEAALNAGKVLEGKTVRFRVNDLRPKSAFGYNLETGKHLNFVSPHNPKVKVGDVVIVKVKEVTSTLGSFVIKYSNLHKVPLNSLSKSKKEKLSRKADIENKSNTDNNSSSQQSSSQQTTAQSSSSTVQNSNTAKQQSKPKSQGEINKELGHDPKGAPLLPGQDHAAGADVNGNPDPWVQGQLDQLIRDGYMNPDGTDTEKGKRLNQGIRDDDTDSNNADTSEDSDSSY
ncbi:hypothetical protein NSA03_09110 [Lactobacillus taiwanensis]|uniref:hypothetical protein n=1 Tax=Lactobacillus taiwanensis TaxID=508451 RepID=UPI00214CAF7D|nr:hypothetical protein [Lactobacillus taiwanensis]MCR1917412.1 hypothetical protein [Lactobacillus taiwanensis]